MNCNKFFFLCICAGLFLSCGNRPVQGTTSTRSSSGETYNLNVLSYNIHHANPPSKPDFIDLQAIADVINKEKPDVVGLQEVDVNIPRSNKQNQAEELARLTGMEAFFAKAIDYDGGEYGIAILSKLPMEHMKNTNLPTATGTGGEPRTLVTAVITLPGGRKILFANTHMDAQRPDTNRFLQINRITEILMKETLPVIVMGDLNAVPESRIINKLDAHFTRTCVNNCGHTVPQINPRRTIDFIAFTPGAFNVVEHKVIDEPYASDHLPVKAVLQLKK